MADNPLLPPGGPLSGSQAHSPTAEDGRHDGSALKEEEIWYLRQLMANTERPLGPEEIRSLRTFLVVAEEVRRESEFRAARRLVYGTYQKLVIGLAGFIAAVFLLWDKIIEALRGAGP